MYDRILKYFGKGELQLKEKTLVVTNGIVGLIGGIFLIFAPIFLAGSVVSDAVSSVNHDTISASSTSGASVFILIVKVAVLVLGIMGAVKFKNSDKIAAAPSVLLIVGGAVSMVPFLGWAGGIVTIVGGSIYLANIKKFND